jgi:ribosomal protein S18 acetylase RimI-like enzyme
MSTLNLRRAEPREMDWAYQIFKSGMRNYIEKTWGWNELFQHHSFQENFPASGFTIISLDGIDIGGFCLKQKPGHLLLEMLLIDPAWQRQGYGSEIMQHIMKKAEQQKLPIRLSVLKANPALGFYQALGFTVEDEDEVRYKLLLDIQ